MRASALDLIEGTEIAPGYEVIERISRGAALDVYDAWSLERDCRCVVKLARPDRTEQRVQRRLVREGELLLELAHPYIVRAYELVRRPQTALVLETLDGQTLGHMLEGPQPLSAADIAFLGVQLCAAISYLHSHGFIHLDVKPANLIVENRRVKLIDLSIARRPGPAPRGIGTRGYLAPEQADGRRLTEATDVWGIGATLRDAAAGARRPRRLNELIVACLDPDRDERPTVTELRDGLDTLLA
jgi:serine/threonine protein kinase